MPIHHRSEMRHVLIISASFILAPRSIHNEHRRVIAFPVELPEGQPFDSQESAIEQIA
jgi:hypothetical protein